MASGWNPKIISGFSSSNQNSQSNNPNSFLQDNSFSGGYRGPGAGHMQHLQQQQHQQQQQNQQQQSYCQQQHPAGYHAQDQSSRISSETGGQSPGQQGGQSGGQQGGQSREQQGGQCRGQQGGQSGGQQGVQSGGQQGSQCRGQQGGQSGGQQGVRLQEQRRPGDWDWGEIVEDEFRKEIGKMASEVAQQKNGEKKWQL